MTTTARTMNTDRIVITEYDENGEFWTLVVTGAASLRTFTRHLDPGHRIEARPALDGETTQSLVAEMAERLSAGVARRHIATIRLTDLGITEIAR